jgi:hypothetical protein
VCDVLSSSGVLIGDGDRATGDASYSNVFNAVPSVQPQPAILLAGSTLNPPTWRALDRRLLLFGAQAFDTSSSAPFAAVGIVDNNPNAGNTYAYYFNTSVPFVDYGGIWAVMPLDAPATSSMQLVFNASG